MTTEGGVHGPELAQQLRAELARMQRAEDRIEDALLSMRAARRRLEAIAAALERSEARVRGALPQAPEQTPDQAPGSRPVGPAGLPWRRGASPGWPRRDGSGGPPNEEATPPAHTAPPATATPAEAERRRQRRRLGLVAIAAAATVAAVGWLAFLGLRGGVVAPPLVVSGGGPVAPSSPGGAEEAPERTSTPPGPLADLPAAPAARRALYDSLAQARSPLFEPLLDSVTATTTHGDVKNAVDAWTSPGEVSAKERDLVEAAMVQWILKREVDQRVELDGELLRNPCRGRSCSALLNLWQMGKDRYNFPPMPDEDATTDTQGLATVQAAVVLHWLQELNGPAGPS